MIRRSVLSKLTRLGGILLLGTALLYLGACSLSGGGSDGTPIAGTEATKTPKPTFTPRGASATFTPQGPSATATPVPPTATETATPAPTDTSTPEVSPTPTAYPTTAADVAPFTGKAVEDEATLQRRPVAIKVSNSPAVRPQSGLSSADVVVEHLAEGGVTRFTAIFHSDGAELVGSMRSARLIDLELPVIFDAVLVYSGASPEVTRRIESSDFAEQTLSDWFGDPGFYRVDRPDLRYEHTLFTDTPLLWDIVERRGWNRAPRRPGWAFSQEPPAGGDEASVMIIPYNDRYSDVRYEYDADLEAYRRWVTGDAHRDALTEEQLTIRNVVVAYANHVETLIVEDSLGSRSVEIQLWGEGTATLFRDGQAYQGRWTRPNRPDPLRFLDANGNPLPMKPGNTWIQLVPLDLNVTHR